MQRGQKEGGQEHLLSAPPSEGGLLSPLGLTATQERRRGCITEPQVSKPAPGPQIVATLTGGTPQRTKPPVPTTLGGDLPRLQPGCCCARICRKVWMPYSFHALVLPMAPKVRPECLALDKIQSGCQASPSPSFPRSRMKGKRMLICVSANLKRSINSAAWRRSSAEGVV